MGRGQSVRAFPALIASDAGQIWVEGRGRVFPQRAGTADARRRESFAAG